MSNRSGSTTSWLDLSQVFRTCLPVAILAASPVLAQSGDDQQAQDAGQQAQDAGQQAADQSDQEVQDADQFVIEEVVVTARRREENLQDVPGTVTALTETVLENAGVTRAADFVAMIPGVSMVDAAEVGDTQVGIRGINGARDAENSFGFIVDGILHTNPAALNREYSNLQQIEVFKGPQGAIYGRNAASGAIIVTTRKPGNELELDAKASLGQDSTSTAALSVSGPLKEDEVFVNVWGDWRKSDGFFRNSFQSDGAIVDTFQGYDVGGRLVWEASDRLTFDTKVRYGKVDASSIVFNSIFHLPVFATATNTPAAFQDSNSTEFVFQPNIVSDNDQQAFEISAKVDYELDGATVTGWFLHSDIDNDLISDGTSAAFGFYNSDPACQQTVTDLNAAGVQLPSPQFIGTSPVGVIFDPNGSFLGAYTPTTCDGIQEQVRAQNDQSGEIRIASSGDQSVRWMLGVYGLTIDRQVGVSLNRDSGADPIRGLLQTSGPNRTAALVFDDFDTRVLAAFGQLQYDVSEEVELSLALRFDSEKRDVSSLVPFDARQSVIDLNFDGVLDDPLNPALSSLINTTGTIPDKSETFSQLQPKISLTWDVAEETTLFADWGMGFKAGGFNNSGSAATVNIFNNSFINGGVGTLFADDLGAALPVIEDDYREQTSSSFEVGFKTLLFDRRLQLNGAGYYTNVDDMHFFEFFVGTFGLLRVVSNIDEVELFGGELGASVYVGDHVTFSLGGNYTKSEIKKNSSRPDTVGAESPYTPTYNLNAALDFDIPVNDAVSVVAHFDGQITGKTWFHTVQEGQRPTIFQPLFQIGFGPGAGALGIADFSNARRNTYGTLNARVGLEGGHWSVVGYGSNLFDKKFLEEVIPAPEFGGTFDAPGARRRLGVEVAVNF